MKTTFTASLTALALLAAAIPGPATAAGATRSVQALPLLAASVGSVPYKNGAENTWRCVPVNDEALKLKDAYVHVDEAGRVVVDPKGAPFTCRSPGAALGQRGGFPFKILLGALGLGGLALALAGGGGNDSTG